LLSINELKQTTILNSQETRRSSFCESVFLTVQEKSINLSIDSLSLNVYINRRISVGEATRVRHQSEYDEAAERKWDLDSRVLKEGHEFMEYLEKHYDELMQLTDEEWKERFGPKMTRERLKKQFAIIQKVRKPAKKIITIVLKIFMFIRNLIRKFISWLTSKFSPYERFAKEVKSLIKRGARLKNPEDISPDAKIHILPNYLEGEAPDDYNNVLGRWFRGLHMLGKVNNINLSSLKESLKRLDRSSKIWDKRVDRNAPKKNTVIPEFLNRIHSTRFDSTSFVEFVVDARYEDFLDVKEENGRKNARVKTLDVKNPYTEILLKDIESQFDFGQYYKAFVKTVNFFVEKRRALISGGEWNKLSHNLDKIIDLYNKNSFHANSVITEHYVKAFQDYMKYYKNLVKYSKNFEANTMAQFTEDYKIIKENTRLAGKNEDNSHFRDPDEEYEKPSEKTKTEKGGFGGYLENKGGNKNA